MKFQKQTDSQQVKKTANIDSFKVGYGVMITNFNSNKIEVTSEYDNRFNLLRVNVKSKEKRKKK
jgi:hypothetical protein